MFEMNEKGVLYKISILDFGISNPTNALVIELKRPAPKPEE